MRSYIKHSTQLFITRSNTSKFVENTRVSVVFSTLLLCVASGDETLRLILDKLFLQNCICLKLIGNLTHFDMVNWHCFDDFMISPISITLATYYYLIRSINNMLFSHVKISSFRAKVHLVFHWCLYNKDRYSVYFTFLQQ